ncbi:MAG: NAD(P)/FAD-dependent oxidoreductase [Asgard group archaeon]|nr:NAD(P)/FAD-dependent oxidoreductase [Asgard group archaeon]
MIDNHSEVIVIGAGPAGCATAIQLKRYGVDVIVFEKNEIGGLARNANLIENFIGFPDGITGLEFCSLLKDHINKLGIEIIKEEILEIDWDSKDNKLIIKSDKEEYTSKYLVLAIGTEPNKLKQKNEKELVEQGFLFYEPIDLLKNQDSPKSVVIIGGGDAAFDYALNLAENNYQITIIHRNSYFNCLPLLHKRASEIDSIKIKKSSFIKKFTIEENQVLLNLNKDESLKSDYVLVAIGRKPRKITVHKNLKKLRKENRIYLIGDLVSGLNRQISIAAGQGLDCAMWIARDINKI